MATENRLPYGTRRMFAMTCIYDVAVTLMMWVCFDSNLDWLFEAEIFHYNFEVSWFDLLALSCVRVVFLIPAYSVRATSDPTTVYCVTAGSTVFLLFKSLLIDSRIRTLQGMLFILYGFFATWSEYYAYAGHHRDTQPTYSALAQTLAEELGGPLLDNYEHQRKDFLRDVRDDNYVPPNHEFGMSSEDQSECYESIIDSGDPLPRTSPLPGSYREMIDAAVADMLDIEEAQKTRAEEAVSSEWQFHSEQNGVAIYRKQVIDDSDVTYTKGVTILKDTAQAIADVILRTQSRPEWDSLIKKISVVELLVPDAEVQNIVHEGMWPTTPRDYCVLQASQTLPDGAIAIVSFSIEHPLVPPTSSCTRGTLKLGGFVVRPTASKRSCVVTCASIVDLKGWVPALVTSGLAVKAPLALAGLRDAISRSKGLDDDEEMYI